MRRLALRAPLAPLALAALTGLAQPASGHEVRPGYLELSERAPNTFDVLWKVPMRGNLRLRLDPVFPSHCRSVTPVSAYESPGAVVERWSIDCDESLVGHTVAVEGLTATLTDVLLRLELLDGSSLTARLRSTAPSFAVPREPTRSEVARTYLWLGIEHILGGIDHLLFVLALLMIVSGGRRLVATVTSFTLAHSITLALAVLGFVHVPSAPVEAVIALSILFLASELAHSRQGRSGLTERYPWIVAFTFGLLHGFGFAGALTEIGLPQSAIPLALFLFNLGVELGQLLFVAGALLVVALLRRLPLSWPEWSWQVPTYAIGSVAAFWTLQRVAAFFA